MGSGSIDLQSWKIPSLPFRCLRATPIGESRFKKSIEPKNQSNLIPLIREEGAAPTERQGW